MDRPPHVFVVLCSDLFVAPTALQRTALVAGLKRRRPATEIATVADLCTHPERLAEALNRRTGDRVVIGCRGPGRLHLELAIQARASGIMPGALAIVDLRALESGDPTLVLEHSIAQLVSALANLERLNIGLPVLASADTGRQPRALLRMPGPEDRPMAMVHETESRSRVWGAHWVHVCPTGAIAAGPSGLQIHPEKCTGCGRCQTAGPAELFVVPGWSLSQLQAQLETVLPPVNISRPAGIAFVCRDAQTPPWIGTGWLPITVPSLEMVTAGWLLQVLAGGVPAVVLGACADAACHSHAASLVDYCRSLLRLLEVPASHGRAGIVGRDLLPRLGPVCDRTMATPLVLREPSATVTALRMIGAWGGTRPVVHLQHPRSPLGVVTIDQPACTLCACCTTVCPDGALMHQDDGDYTSLRFDASCCTGCGACVTHCPESALSVQHITDLAAVGAGQVTIAAQKLRHCATCGKAFPPHAFTDHVRARLLASHPMLASRNAAQCMDCLMGMSPGTGPNLRR
jgi:ferredoxin